MRSKFISLEEAQNFLGREQGAPEGTNRKDLNFAAAMLETGIRRQLTERQQECVRMYYFEGMTLVQIAEALGVAPSTVCRHLKKARARLKDFMSLAEEIRGVHKD